MATTLKKVLVNFHNYSKATAKERKLGKHVVSDLSPSAPNNELRQSDEKLAGYAIQKGISAQYDGYLFFFNNKIWADTALYVLSVEMKGRNPDKQPGVPLYGLKADCVIYAYPTWFIDGFMVFSSGCDDEETTLFKFSRSTGSYERSTVLTEEEKAIISSAELDASA